ncbi:sn-glycerol-3-phosphate import ATP-binding protein UgpC [Salinivibrio sp. EAGSL]|jgi:sn-glycerol 3-phosphate transport system ATP-binding protein|uniref:sn-glycerol-3-phosphate import ATP-binding protein UgpC n=1 Tax=Salinivibrio sp. EAGSL TaxID=2738468 RepID=UPI00158F0178|nr:sn-glycerol-3-phosphate import ATP-binding protein UgpC [Salinivibrio sp. EAGSL]NUY55032.1 sn-glycerol-3-phosphate import ATP-binding protein UgpC [Salinivibrio sp. EAGSL]
MATVTLDQLQKTYPNGFKAIHGVDLAVQDGEMIVLVGPSGCGKSTLLRMIAGLEAISDGDLIIDNKRVNDLEPGERDIAMVFQNYALYPHMSVFNNMAYGLRNRGTPKAEIETLVNEVATMLELDHLLDRRPNQLSGGQRQRVAMGRAIVRRPKVFLFDEPLSNLDAKLRVQMRLEIKSLQRKLKTTAVYVTHDQVEAMTLADRLVVLNGGNVEQIGTPLEVYDAPASLFVATFIGSPAMNIVDGQIHNHALSIGHHALAYCQGTTASSVCVGLRPEHLKIVPNDQAQFTLSVTLTEALGADLLVYGHIADTDSLITLRLEGHSKVIEGDQLPLAIDPHNLHVFAAESGKRLTLDVKALSDERVVAI